MAPSDSDASSHKPRLKQKPPLAYEVIRKSTPLLTLISVICAGVCLLFTFIGTYERKNKTPGKFYAVNAQKATTMYALQRPNETTNVILDWAKEAATAANTFDFYNYNDVLKKIRPYFTDAGYQNYINAIRPKIKQVVQKRMVVSSVPLGTPVILKEGKIVGDLYAWQVQFPMLVTYESQAGTDVQKVTVTLLIAQVPTIESPKGIGIASYIAGEAKQ